MKTLYLAWQAPSRAWFPIGQLDAEVEKPHYAFRYTRGALRAQTEAGLSPLPAFPDLNLRYESSELFPVFTNRLLGRHRKDFAEYVRSLGMDPANPDPIAILGVTGGERQTDSLEVFPKLETNLQHQFSCRFFLHGLRHMTPEAQARALALEAGESLQVSIELNNPTHQLAIQLQTREYHFIGWSPRYLAEDLVQAANTNHAAIDAKVVRINEADVPLNRRILVELTGSLPPTYRPMSGNDFITLH